MPLVNDTILVSVVNPQYSEVSIVEAKIRCRIYSPYTSTKLNFMWQSLKPELHH